MALSHSVSEWQWKGIGNFAQFLPLNWLPWQRPLRYRKKKDGLQFNTYHMVQMLWKSVQRILGYFGSEQTSLLQPKIGCHGNLRNRKNWTWSRKFMQIPSIWWKGRENRSSRYWDSFAHSKKNKEKKKKLTQAGGGHNSKPLNPLKKHWHEWSHRRSLPKCKNSKLSPHWGRGTYAGNITLAWFLPRDAMLSAVYAVVVCLSVCLCVCVCLSHSGIVSKRLNVGSRKQRHTIAPGL